MATYVGVTQTKIYIILFVAIGICYLAFLVLKSIDSKQGQMEHFTEDPQYKFRLEVMKVFEMYLKRNPTPEEIDKYSVLENEQDILVNILQDFNIGTVDIDTSNLKTNRDEDSSIVDEEQQVETYVDTPKSNEKKKLETDTFDDNEKDLIYIKKSTFIELGKKYKELKDEIERINKLVL